MWNPFNFDHDDDGVAYFWLGVGCVFFLTAFWWFMKFVDYVQRYI